MPPLLIGLCGRRGGGKDTAAQFIREWGEGRGLTVVRRSFADKLKHSAMTALGFDVAEQDAVVLADSLKELGEITTVIPNQSVAYTIDGRKFLQLYGTEAHREIFGSNFWVDALLPLGVHETSYGVKTPDWPDNFTVDGASVAHIGVIADVRFDNEAKRIKKLGGHVWRVYRPGGEEDGHASEAGVSDHLIDQTIYNEGSLEDLSRNVKTSMTIDFHMRFVENDMEEYLDSPNS